MASIVRREIPVIALIWLVNLPPKGDFKVTIKARVERSVLGAITEYNTKESEYTSQLQPHQKTLDCAK
jgi:hypothetical protein